ncbi:recombinase RecT [Cupriavidus gilardii]|uniref:recombinase RecT n=1 Tax=Cupriavidus gilardii TaxID=82541 RepID=UPI0021BFAD6E|nr:recombinase RecT [Cupriavidus gilardii]MCT9071223.1 recombinase RecT [Cupriavidus gilardii]
MNEVTTPQHFDLSPRSLDEALKFADMLADSSIVPKDFMGKPGNVLVAIQWGMELGLKPMQAMQNIAVINGRPALWGDAVIALVRSSPLCEYVYESLSEDGTTAYCQVKRRGEQEQVRSFSMADAKTAGLAGKQGPWTQYPKRMLQMRARAFALRDVFPDVLKGIPIAEEIEDYPVEKDITPRNAKPADIARAALPQPAERDDRLLNIIADLELVAREGGAEPLAQAWGGLTKEDRKAIGPDELARLKSLTGEEQEPAYQPE